MKARVVNLALGLELLLVLLLAIVPAGAQGFLSSLFANVQSATTYPVTAADCGHLITLSNSAGVAVTVPQAGTGAAQLASGCALDIVNRGTGNVTITPATSTIDSHAVVVLGQSQGVKLGNDGANYFAQHYGGGAGVLYTIVLPAATATGTTEQTLATYSLPAKALDRTGRRLHVHAAWIAAANANDKTYTLYFGTETITSGILTNSGTVVTADLTILKTGASTQIVSGTMTEGATVIPGVASAATETDTAAITIKATGTDGTSSAADITLEDFAVEYQN
jgi:hypothetical protein